MAGQEEALVNQDEIHVVVPGEPCAQGRPRAFRMKGTGAIRMYDPAKSRNWKAEARVFMLRVKDALGLHELLDGPLLCHIRAVFSCPRSEYRKTNPRGMRLHAKRPDADQIAKAAMDAATGVIWTDDDRVAILRIEKVIGAQGEAPRVEITIKPLGETPTSPPLAHEVDPGATRRGRKGPGSTKPHHVEPGPIWPQKGEAPRVRPGSVSSARCGHGSREAIIPVAGSRPPARARLRLRPASHNPLLRPPAHMRPTRGRRAMLLDALARPSKEAK